MDLGLRTGWAVVQRRAGAAVVVRAGNIDVTRVEGVSLRLQAWARQVGALAQQCTGQGVFALGYEEIRRMTGQGARYILMMEGVLHVVPNLPAMGVNQATLRSYAGMRPRSKANPSPPSWAKRASVVFEGAGMLQSEDQAVAAFVGAWLLDNATEAKL